MNTHNADMAIAQLAQARGYLAAIRLLLEQAGECSTDDQGKELQSDYYYIALCLTGEAHDEACQAHAKLRGAA